MVTPGSSPGPAVPSREPVASGAGQPTGRLLEALRAVGSDLELPVVLRHVVEAAVTLVQAGYGALGVLDADSEGDGLSESITVRVDVAGPVDGPRSGTSLDVPVLVGESVFGHLRLSNKLGGRDFTDDDREVLVTLAVAAGVAVRHARLYEQARRGSAWREAGRSISTSLLSGTEHEDVIALLVETSQSVLSADSVFMSLVRGDDLQVAASSGAPAPAQDTSLLEHLRPVLLEGRPRSAVSGSLSGFAVPLGPAGAACQGVLTALWATPPNPLLVDDLQGFAAQAAVALELADRRREAEHGAVLADRDRIGRDLHDLVIQRLFATGMRLQSALRLIAADPAEATARVDLAVDDLDATIRELRSTIYGLQGPVDGRPSLRARLLEVVDAGTQHLGFAPVLRLDGLLDTVVPDEVTEHVLATVREALSNAARHARASQVEVTVALRDQSLQVVVEDDGVGLAPDGPRSGLHNLASRADQLGGALRVDSGRLAGTRVTWAVPVRDPSPATAWP